MVIDHYKDFRYRFSDTGLPAFDGAEEFPTALIRVNGFDGGFTGIGRPIQSFPIVVSINGTANDGGNAYDWFLSQRTDDLEKQYLLIAQYMALKSGSIYLFLSPLCVTRLGLVSSTAPVNEDNLIDILNNTILYVRRRSDGAIQLVEMLKETLR